MTIERIGLVFDCSDPEIHRAIMADASLRVLIQQRAYADLRFSAFADAAMAQREELPEELKEVGAPPSFSFSLPVDPHLLARDGEQLVAVIDMPARIVDQIKLKERDVLVGARNAAQQDWFVALGVRLIGKKIRALL